MLHLNSPLSRELEELVRQTIGCCIAVHRALGPGLLETIYQRAVSYELETSRVPFEREKPIWIVYRGRRLYLHRLDLVISGQLLLELKAVDRLHPVHHAQVLSSLRASELRLALLVNFNVVLLRQGIRRIVL
jgi:GxxExxY protein